MSQDETRRVFIGGVGYRFLRDMSVGPELVAELKRLNWPGGVEIDDLSPGGPIAAVHRFREAPPYERVILFGSVKREREAGQIYCYRWDGQLPSPDEIQERVSEAVTGVISLDNLLIIGGHFAIWPPLVVIVELEPRDEDWGEEYSPPVQAAIPHLIETLRQASLAPAANFSTEPFTKWRHTS